MFKTQRMQHVSLWVLRSEAPQAALLLATYGIFTPEQSQAWERDLPDTPGDAYMQVYAEAHARLTKILSHFGEETLPAVPAAVEIQTDLDAPTLEGLHEWNAWLGELWNAASRCEEQQHQLKEDMAHTESQLNLLTHFRALDIDLSWLARPKRFLQTRIGTVSSANVARLTEALGLSGFQLEIFDTQEGRDYAVAIGPIDRAGEIRGALDAAGWQEIVLDQELMAHPEAARANLLGKMESLRNASQQCTVSHDHKLGDVGERLNQIRQGLALAEPYVRISAETLRARGGLALITGWIAEHDIDRMRQALDARLADHTVLQMRPPLASELDSVPSSVRYPNWLGPFAGLVRNYGIPRYGEFDPTWLFAISFVLMFGMMFGDVGQGLVIALGGWLLRGKARAFRSLFVASGLAATAFGFAYGSVFGFETLIEPLWLSPLHDPVRMLTAAVWWGIGFITVAQLLTITNRLGAGEVRKALFDAGGVAGLLLYLGMVAGVYGLAVGRGVGWLPALVMCSGFVVILVWNWLEHHGGAAERILTVLIESLESIIGFFSNTLSFMRVAAFSINHVALSLAVFTIADNFEEAGRWLTIAIGNLIILLLEGAIVAIQVLRLEYYEGFSRFYSGGGRAARPLVLHDMARGQRGRTAAS